MANLLPLMVVIPLAAAFIIPVFALVRRIRFCGAFAVLVSVALAVLSGCILSADGPLVLWVGGWSPGSATGIAIVADGLTRLMLVVVNWVGLAAVVFALSYMRHYTRVHLFYSPLMLMVAGMNGIVISGDLFNIYVFVEVAAVASYALVGFGGGPHTCLGMNFAYTEMKVIFSLLFKRYKLELVDPNPKKDQSAATSRPARPCPIRYQKR